MAILIFAEKKHAAFTLLELIIVLAIVNCLTLLAIPVYQSAVKHKAWAATLVTTTPLRRAIAQCLIDSKGDATACNDFSVIKLAKYGVTTAPTDISFVTMLTSNATIKIASSSKLGGCVATFTPSVRLLEKTTVWKCAMQKQEEGDSLEECKKHLYECT